jgi:hypothetical protein
MRGLVLCAVALVAVAASAAGSEPRWALFEDAPRAVAEPSAASWCLFEAPRAETALQKFARDYRGTHFRANEEPTRQRLVRMYGFRAEDLAPLTEREVEAVMGSVITGALPASLRPICIGGSCPVFFR